jgi:SNF2 family DNA or RNA helicase
MTQIQTFSESVIDELKTLSGTAQNQVLFVEQHPEYPTHFLVNSFDPLFAHRLKDLIGPYRAVSMFKLDQLKDKAEEEGYERLIFVNDPKPTYERIRSLTQPYPYDLNGIELYKFQLQGFNFLRDSLADIVNWSTGAGKSVYAIAKAKYLLETNKIDRVVIAARNHNKINWQRDLKRIGGLDATIVDSTASAEIHKGSQIRSAAEVRRAERTAQYADAQIIIVNYEKFRLRGQQAIGERATTGDGEEIIAALKKQRVYFVWDEMPRKLKNPKSAQYKGARTAVQTSKAAYQSLLSATPIENEPEDVYSCVKILQIKLKQKIFTTKKAFHKRYAKSMNPWAQWKVQTWDMEALHEMGMRLAHMTHQADKYKDPEIRAQFPKEAWEDVIIDMSEEDRRLYMKVQKQIVEEFKMHDDILSKLLVLQLICNNPASLALSESDLARAVVAKYNPTDRYSAKLDTLRELLDQVSGKVVLFSMYNDLGAKMLKEYIGDWGHSYVLFDGSARKKQEALDSFKSDRRIKIFISSDQGSDSINLQEASTVINYDLPWLHSTLVQRVNRINRITSEAEWTYYFNLIVANTMEDRKIKVLAKKKSLQEAVFGGEISQQAEDIGRMNFGDLWYLLTGEGD